ncbi:MAG: RimK family alpha-L-glutamate ligase [Desulfobacterales bacterium]|nr:RimK family alpha-L-glutamate ligase [Desulfobacterales bacterium]
MKIGIMTVNGFDFHPNQRFRQEAENRGHSIVLINPYDMGCRIDESGYQVFWRHDHSLFDKMSTKDDLPDLIMPRQGSPMGEYGFVLLRQFEALGIPLINGIDGVTITRNQYITLQKLTLEGLSVPDSVFVTKKDNFYKGVDALGGFPVVAKQVDGMGGDGVAKLDTQDAVKAYLDTYFIPLKGVVIEPFLDHIQDLRLLVVGDKVAGAMSLTPAPGQFKANIHQQAYPESFEPTDEMAEIAVRAARACSLEIAGVDMMVTREKEIKVIEVNYSPGFRGLEEATGKNIAGIILDYVLAKV